MDACRTGLGYERQTIGRLVLAEIDEEQLGAIDRILGIAVEGIQYVEDTVDAETDADT